MAQINVTTTSEERDKVLQALHSVKGEITPVSKIAELAGLKQSRTRYALIDLVDAGIIERVPHRAFNAHYVRYSYNIL